MGRLRILSALTVGLLFALVMITVVEGVAFGDLMQPLIPLTQEESTSCR